MPGPVFVYHHRVTYCDCTVGNHIYYGRYLHLLEAARGEFFRSLEFSFATLQEQGFVFPVCECRLRYKAPARYDEMLLIGVQVTLAKGVRLNFAYHVKNQAGTSILEAETLHACTGLDEKPRRLPTSLQEVLIIRATAHRPSQVRCN